MNPFKTSVLWALLFITANTALCLKAEPRQGQRVDPAAADRGKKLYAQFCVNCHGTAAKGTDRAPDLIRSVAVLRDKSGNQIGPVMKKLPDHSDFSPSQITDLSLFLKQRIEETSRNRNPTRPPNVLTGNAEAGRKYFTGAGRCNTCHSPEGDLAGIGRKYEPVALQQRFLFPRRGGGSEPVLATVTPADGAAVSGTLVHIDDFDISLRDSAGEYHAWPRVPGLKVELRDPYAAHDELLDRYEDADIHNIVAYLEKLK